MWECWNKANSLGLATKRLAAIVEPLLATAAAGARPASMPCWPSRSRTVRHRRFAHGWSHWSKQILAFYGKQGHILQTVRFKKISGGALGFHEHVVNSGKAIRPWPISKVALLCKLPWKDKTFQVGKIMTAISDHEPDVHFFPTIYHQHIQVPEMEESSPIDTQYGYGLCKGIPTP